MGNLLQKTDFVYCKILYVLWRLAAYYADLFSYEAPENPLELKAAINNMDGLKELSFIRLELPAIAECDCGRMKEILNEYLTLALLPESQIPLYVDGERNIIEPLYIFKAYYDHTATHKTLVWIALYINNNDAYNLYKEDLKR